MGRGVRKRHPHCVEDTINVMALNDLSEGFMDSYSLTYADLYTIKGGKPKMTITLQRYVMESYSKV